MISGIDIVVVNYRTPGDLAAFLTSITLNPPSRNSHSTFICNVDPLYEDQNVAMQANVRGAKHIFEFSENVGYARAVNRGAVEGVHDVLAIFNADVVLTEGALDECADHLRSNPTWAALGPLQVNEANRITHAGIFGTHKAPVHRGWMEHERGQYVDVKEAVTVSGSAYFVKRAVWNELNECPLYREIAPDAEGAFLPTQHYYEETWCSYHAHAHGYKVMYDGTVKIFHGWHKASPHGGAADKEMKRSQVFFRNACDYHQIDHN